MRTATCRTCRTPIAGKGPAVIPRKLALLGADGKAKDGSDTYRYHKKRDHDVSADPGE